MSDKVKVLFCVFWLFFQLFLYPSANWRLPAIDLSDDAIAAVGVQVAMDATGNAIAVWSISDGSGRFIIQTRRYDVTTGLWATPTINLSAIAIAADEPQIAMDAAGNAIAVWSTTDGAGDRFLETKRYDVTTGVWSTPVINLDSNLQASFFDVQVAMDVAGNAIAVWSKRDDGTGKFVIQTKRYNVTTGVWSAPAIVLSEATQNASDPQIAMDATGNATAVWTISSETQEFVQAKRYDATTGLWSTPAVNLSGSVIFANEPQVAMDASGNAIAVWSTTDGTGLRILATKKYDITTGVWSTPVINLDSNLQASFFDVQIAMDVAGNAIAVWSKRDDGTGKFVIQTKRYDAITGVWSTPAIALSNATQNADDPQVAMDATGNATAVWTISSETQKFVQAKSYDVTTGLWSTPAVNLSDGEEVIPREPQVAMSVGGNVVVGWESIRVADDQELIQAAIYSSGIVHINGIIQNLVGRKTCHRFPTQSDVIDFLQWDAFEGAAKYRIYLDENLSNLVSEIPSNQNLSFEFHGRCPGKKKTYYVVAVDKNGNNVATASITI